MYERAGLSGWDYAFLARGAVMAAGGWAMVRAGRRRAELRPTLP